MNYSAQLIKLSWNKTNELGNLNVGGIMTKNIKVYQNVADLPSIFWNISGNSSYFILIR